MKNVAKFAAAVVAASLLLPLSGCFVSCEKQINYLDYVTEKRQNIYLYEDDEVSVKIYCSVKESPFSADGYVGDMCPLTEIFVTLPKNYDEVAVTLGEYSGEMNYQSVENDYYLSFSAEDFGADSVDVTLSYGEYSNTYPVQSVKYAGILSCEEALQCVIDYAGDVFNEKTENGLFDGEIFIRLLYDDGCY